MPTFRAAEGQGPGSQVDCHNITKITWDKLAINIKVRFKRLQYVTDETC